MERLVYNFGLLWIVRKLLRLAETILLPSLGNILSKSRTSLAMVGSEILPILLF